MQKYFLQDSFQKGNGWFLPANENSECKTLLFFINTSSAQRGKNFTLVPPVTWCFFDKRLEFTYDAVQISLDYKDLIWILVTDMTLTLNFIPFSFIVFTYANWGLITKGGKGVTLKNIIGKFTFKRKSSKDALPHFCIHNVKLCKEKKKTSVI